MIRVLLSIIPLAVAVFIFFDANRFKTVLFSSIVSVAAFLTFPIGPLLYLMFRKQFVLETNANLSFCSRCGYSSPKRLDICPKCQNKLQL